MFKHSFPIWINSFASFRAIIAIRIEPYFKDIARLYGVSMFFLSSCVEKVEMITG